MCLHCTEWTPSSILVLAQLIPENIHYLEVKPFQRGLQEAVGYLPMWMGFSFTSLDFYSKLQPLSNLRVLKSCGIAFLLQFAV